MDVNQLYSHFGTSLVEVKFMDDTDSYNKYGAIVGGRLTLISGTGFIKTLVPHGIDISKGESMGFSISHKASKLALIVNAGCKSVYNISKVNVKRLSEEGFSVFDIEPNGIKLI